MIWHVIEGEAGCTFAREHDCVAVVVDALRASATAAMFLDAGAMELLVVREVDEAFEARRGFSDAVLAGERGGLPPDGFDLGNSPRDTAIVAERPVIFTTTTGAGRLVSCWGAAAIYMGTTVNASTVVRYAASHERDVVLIPAGLADDPEFDAQEDWVAATVIAMRASDASFGEGADQLSHWRNRIREVGVPMLFTTAPHAAKLRKVGLDEDIDFCAQVDVTDAVPMAVERRDSGIRCLRAPGPTR